MTTKKKSQAEAVASACARAELVSGFGADFYSRTIYLVDEIDPETAYRFVTNFRIMDSYPGAIEIILDSPGGSDTEGYFIYDTIRAAKNAVYIVSMGSCQSIAAMILQAAPYRLMTPRCRFMIHNASICQGPESLATDTVASIHKELKKNNAIYHDILSERSGLSIIQIKRMCKDETYLTAEEAVELGFADAVVMPDGTMKTLSGKDFRNRK